MGFCLVAMFSGLAVPVQLLREQIRRAGIGNMLLQRMQPFSSCSSPISVGEGAQTVRDFHYRERPATAKRSPSSAAAHDHRIRSLVGQNSALSPADGAPAYSRRAAQTLPGWKPTRKRHHAFRSTARRQSPAFHRIGGADVLHQHADIRRAVRRGTRLPGENLRLLVL